MLVVKNPPANAGDVRDVGFIPGAGRSSGDGHSNPLQYSFLENSTDRGAWQASPWGHSWSNLACVVSLNKNKKNKFILLFLFFLKYSSSLYIDRGFWHISFPLSEELLLNISFRAGLLLVNIISFCLRKSLFLIWCWRIVSLAIEF